MNIEKAQAALRAKRERGEKIVVLNPIQKANNNPKSLRLAINGKCYDCEGGDSDPSIKWRIGNCVMEDCTLYPVRPYQTLKDSPIPKNLEPS